MKAHSVTTRRPLHRIGVRTRGERTAYAFLLPFLIGFGALYVWPLIQALDTSLYDQGISRRDFVGLGNYTDLFQEDVVRGAMVNTVMLVLVVVPIVTVLSLGIAITTVERSSRARAFVRSAFFLPVVASSVVLSVVWLQIYHPVNGLLNSILSVASLGPVPWLGLTETALWAIAAVVISFSLGTPIIIYLAALDEIPQDLVDAARVDGAGRRQELWHVVIPLLRPATVFVLITTLIGTAQVFAVVQILTDGGPANATQTLVFRIYREGFGFAEFGRASAMGVILLVFSTLASLAQLRFGNRDVGY